MKTTSEAKLSHRFSGSGKNSKIRLEIRLEDDEPETVYFSVYDDSKDERDEDHFFSYAHMDVANAKKAAMALRIAANGRRDDGCLEISINQVCRGGSNPVSKIVVGRDESEKLLLTVKSKTDRDGICEAKIPISDSTARELADFIDLCLQGLC